MLGFAGTVSSGSARAANVVRVPYSIDPTGKNDVSAQMQSFFATVPDGSVVVFGSHAQYQMDETLVLDRRHGLTIEGNGATIFAATPGDAHRSNIRLVESNGIVVRDLTVKGANPNGGTSLGAYVPAKEFQHAFELLGVNNLVLDHVAAFDTYGDFVYLGKAAGSWSSHVTIENSTFERNGRQGISLIDASDVLISNNTISDVRRATFDFEPDGRSDGVSNVVIENNTIGAGRLFFVAAAGLQPVNHVEILDNSLHHQSLQMAIRNDHSNYREEWKIIGNVSDAVFGNPLGSAMRLWHVDDLEIARNAQHFQSGRRMVLVELHYSCHVSVHDNMLYNSVGAARSFDNC
jgi:parallel beta-helix repeat protein